MATCIPRVDGLSTDPRVGALHLMPKRGSSSARKEKNKDEKKQDRIPMR